MSEPRRRWVARMPTHAELESDDLHQAEELPQGPIPTGPEFRVMRLIRGFSLGDMADLDDMAGARVQVTRANDAVLVIGTAARVQMLFPLDIEEFWDVVEDVAAAGPGARPARVAPASHTTAALPSCPGRCR